MTTTVKTETRQTLTRSWRDLDPKIAVQALLVIVAWVALLVLFLLGKIPAAVLAEAGGPASVVTLVGYLKRSSHKDLVYAAEQGIREAEAVAPLVEAALPAVTPVVDEAEGILSSIGLGTAPAPQPRVEAPVSPLVPTGTVSVSVSANGGGQ